MLTQWLYTNHCNYICRQYDNKLVRVLSGVNNNPIHISISLIPCTVGGSGINHRIRLHQVTLEGSFVNQQVQQEY